MIALPRTEKGRLALVSALLVAALLVAGFATMGWVGVGAIVTGLVLGVVITRILDWAMDGE